MGISPGVKARHVDLDLRRMEMQLKRQLFQGALRKGQNPHRLFAPATKHTFLVAKGAGRGSVYDGKGNYLGDIPIKIPSRDLVSLGAVVIKGLNLNSNGDLDIGRHHCFSLGKEYIGRKVEMMEFENGVLLRFMLEGEKEPRNMSLVYEIKEGKEELRDSFWGKCSPEELKRYTRMVIRNLTLTEMAVLNLAGEYRFRLGKEYANRNIERAEFESGILVRFKLEDENEPRSMSLLYEVMGDGSEILRNSFWRSGLSVALSKYDRIILRHCRLNASGSFSIGMEKSTGRSYWFGLGESFAGREVEWAEFDKGILIRAKLKGDKGPINMVVTYDANDMALVGSTYRRSSEGCEALVAHWEGARGVYDTDNRYLGQLIMNCTQRQFEQLGSIIVKGINLNGSGGLSIGGGSPRFQLGKDYANRVVEWAEFRDGILLRFKIEGVKEPTNMTLVYTVKDGTEKLEYSFITYTLSDKFKKLGRVVMRGMKLDLDGGLRVGGGGTRFQLGQDYAERNVEWAEFENGILLKFKLEGEKNPRDMSLIYEGRKGKELLRDSFWNTCSEARLNKYQSVIVKNFRLNNVGGYAIGGSRPRFHLGEAYANRNVEWAEFENGVMLRFKLEGEEIPRNMSLVYEVRDGREILKYSFYGFTRQEKLKQLGKVIIKNLVLNGNGALYIGGGASRFILGKAFAGKRVGWVEMENGVLLKARLESGKELEFVVSRDGNEIPINSMYRGEMEFCFLRGMLFERACESIYRGEYEHYNKERELNGVQGIRPDFTCDSLEFAREHGYIVWADAKYSSWQRGIKDRTIPRYLQALKERAAGLTKELGKPIEYRLDILHIHGGNNEMMNGWSNEPVFFINVLKENRHRLEAEGRDYVVRFLEYLRDCQYHEGIEEELVSMKLQFDKGEFPWFQ